VDVLQAEAEGGGLFTDGIFFAARKNLANCLSVKQEPSAS